MHIHTYGELIDGAALLAEMEKAGVYGGCIFSPPSDAYNPKTGFPFRCRLDHILAITKGYEDRLFPILWIHPYEENIIENVKIAAAEGIAGFKIICNNFYPYEDKCIELLKVIASLDLPVFFHSGILYSKGVSRSEYSRPIHFEKLEEIQGLRFSLAHCGWPWIDECLALYGRMSHNLVVAPKGTNPPEMFLDTTPGAPMDRREEFLTKLYMFGQNTGDNILFGIDQCAESYQAKNTLRWIDADRQFMNKLGIRDELRKKTYNDNLMRFLGKPEYRENFVRRIWGTNPYSADTAAICEKWYKKLNFPKEYDAEFYDALKKYHISDSITIETYNLSECDGKRNLLSFLYLCEALSKKYEEKGIPEKILLDTLKDILLWTDAWSDIKGELHLGELAWLSFTMKMRLFRLGSLEFMAGKAHADCPEIGLKAGDDIMEVHIPNGANLSPESCKASLDEAKEFFARYFPEYKFNHFTCHSWLLDPSLDNLLTPDSNIIKFRNMFTPIKADESYAALKYVFRWNTNRRSLRNAVCASSLAERMKAYVLNGGVLHEALGAIRIVR